MPSPSPSNSRPGRQTARLLLLSQFHSGAPRHMVRGTPGVSCPGCVPSRPLAHPQPACWETATAGMPRHHRSAAAPPGHQRCEARGGRPSLPSSVLRRSRAPFWLWPGQGRGATSHGWDAAPCAVQTRLLFQMSPRSVQTRLLFQMSPRSGSGTARLFQARLAAFPSQLQRAAFQLGFPENRH